MSVQMGNLIKKSTIEVEKRKNQLIYKEGEI